MDSQASVVAKNDHALAGFLLSVDLQHSLDLSDQRRIIDALKGLMLGDTPILSLRACIGQIVVSSAFRQQGIGQGLYKAFLDIGNQFYDVRLAEVCTENLPSLKFHTEALKMKPIGSFMKAEKEFLILALDLR